MPCVLYIVCVAGTLFYRETEMRRKATFSTGTRTSRYRDFLIYYDADAIEFQLFVRIYSFSFLDRKVVLLHVSATKTRTSLYQIHFKVHIIARPTCEQQCRPDQL